MRYYNSLTNFFYPRNVLLVGASSKPRTIGFEILKSMVDFGFKGKIFVVNPRSDEILGIRCNKTIEEIEEEISLAIILVPKNLVIESLKSCAERQIKNVVIVTAGFREVGLEGAKLEEQIVQLAKEKNIRIVGPNCMGLINTDEEVRLNATFAAEIPQYSPISFLSQSGALAAAVLNTIKQSGYTFGQFISIGNKADVNENDLLNFWWKDEKTKIITMYLESFENGRKFFDLAKKVTREKPVVILKAARTKTGSFAASSHTGALATQDDIVNAALRLSGCIRVDTVEEMFETSKALLTFSNLKGNRIAVLTNAGGPAILATDEAEKNGLILPTLSDKTINKLRELLHPEASVNNPVDMLPAADAQTYRMAAKILSEDKNIDAIISIFVEPVMIDSFEVIKELTEEQRINSKPILIVAFPLPHFWDKWNLIGNKNSLILKSVELAPKVVKNLFNFYTRKIHNNEIQTKTNQKTYLKINDIISKIKQKNGDEFFLNSRESRKIVSILKLPLVKSKFFKDDYEFQNILHEIYFPCVLKISSRRLTHKSEVGGIILNIQSKNELFESYKKLKNKLKKEKYLDLIDEFEIQEYFKGETELIIGGYRDKSFGAVINFGAGGRLVELIKDKNLALAPLSRMEAYDIIQSSKVYSLLRGYRNIEKTDLSKLVEIILKISDFLHYCDGISEIDLNPVMIKGEKIKIVDLRIKI